MQILNSNTKQSKNSKSLSSTGNYHIIIQKYQSITENHSFYKIIYTHQSNAGVPTNISLISFQVP